MEKSKGLCAVVLLILCSCAQTGEVPVKYANYSGDIVLAGFFPIHSYEAHTLGSNHCGDIQSQDGIQPLEAFFHVLDVINESDLLPGFRLGAIAADSCDDDSHALDQSVELMGILMTRIHGSSPYICSDGSIPNIQPGLEDYQKVVGAVGGSSSAVSIQLANLLKLFTIPQVSYLSTSPDLSSVTKYPYFRRTVPPDSNQAEAIIKVLKAFGWQYVSVIYEDSNYGAKGFAELQSYARVDNICFAEELRIEIDEASWNEEDYDDIIKSLKIKSRAKAVVMFLDFPQARQVFAAAKRQNVSAGEFVWIGSDAWSGRSAAVEGYEDVASGAITVQPLAFTMPDFDQYFTSLKPDTNERNPWFGEFWESNFNCKLVDEEDEQTRNNTLKAGIPLCTGQEEISSENGYFQQTYLHYIWDATYSFAHTLRKMHEEVCGPDYEGLCHEMAPINMSGPSLNERLANITFTATNGHEFQFVNGVDGPPRYTIKYYHRNPGGQYEWGEVGNYSGLAGEKELYFEPSFEDHVVDAPISACSEPCQIGQIKQFLPGDWCCWVCSNCSEYSIAVPTILEGLCIPCPDAYLPNQYRNICLAIPETYMDYNSPHAIGSMILSVLGVACTCLVISIFIFYMDTPVIKASGRELSFYLLGGILLSYGVTFVIVAKPSQAICGLTRLFIGLCFTVVYATILTKTNRISRIFSASTSPKKARLTSPKSQLFLVNALVLVEFLILAAWLAAAPPEVTYIYPRREDNIFSCSGADDATYLIALIYPFCLLILCTFYAFKTRKCPDGFNETKLIGLTCYTTCVIWLAFFGIYFITFNPFLRTMVICLSISLNATVALACIFVPKLYICIWRPEKNTREAIMIRSSSIISSSSMLGGTYDDDHRRRSSQLSGGKQDSYGSLSGGNDIGNGTLTLTPSTLTNQYEPSRPNGNDVIKPYTNIQGGGETVDEHNYDNQGFERSVKDDHMKEIPDSGLHNRKKKGILRDNSTDKGNSTDMDNEGNEINGRPGCIMRANSSPSDDEGYLADHTAERHNSIELDDISISLTKNVTFLEDSTT